METLFDAEFLIKLILCMVAAVGIIYFFIASSCGSLPPHEPNIVGFIYDEQETILDKIKKFFN